MRDWHASGRSDPERGPARLTARAVEAEGPGVQALSTGEGWGKVRRGSRSCDGNPRGLPSRRRSGLPRHGEDVGGCSYGAQCIWRSPFLSRLFFSSFPPSPAVADRVRLGRGERLGARGNGLTADARSGIRWERVCRQGGRHATRYSQGGRVRGGQTPKAGRPGLEGPRMALGELRDRASGSAAGWGSPPHAGG